MNFAAIATILGAAYLLMDEDDPQKYVTHRSVWVHEWVKKRQTEGCYAKLLVELKNEHPNLYRNFVRMTAEDFEYLLNLVTPYIRKQDTFMRLAIPPGERLALTLRYLATGESFMSLQYLFRIPQPTISQIIPEVLDAIYKVLKEEYLKVPSTENEWETIATKFNELWNFPNCLGAVDGKHVVMNAPPNSGSIFYNYKGTHSIVLMGIADAEYKLTYVDVGCNGRLSDGGVFKKCSFARALEQNRLNIPAAIPLPSRETPVPYVLVGDDAFAMKPNLLKPNSGKNLVGLKRIFNYRLSRARRIIENVFGIMSARFRVLRQPINLDANKTRKVTLACCALHNYLMSRSNAVYAPPGSYDRYDANGKLIPGEWRETMTDTNMYPVASSTQYIADNAKKIREEFEQYFVNEGDLSWQYNNI